MTLDIGAIPGIWIVFRDRHCGAGRVLSATAVADRQGLGVAAAAGDTQPGCFRQRAPGDALHTEITLHCVQIRHLLQAAQRRDGRIEKIQQQQTNILIEKEIPVMCLVARRANVVKSFKLRRQLLQIPTALHSTSRKFELMHDTCRNSHKSKERFRQKMCRTLLRHAPQWGRLCLRTYKILWHVRCMKEIH